MTDYLTVLLASKMEITFPGGLLEMIVRWIHFVAGITWIGLLYFFNIVNAQVMAQLDGPTKGKVIPVLMPRALWFFRWSALVTVLAGIYYWVMIILGGEPPTAEGSLRMKTAGLWLVIVLVCWVVNMVAAKQPATRTNGWVFAAINTVIILVMSYLMLHFLAYEGMSGRAMSIAIGGGMGTFMLFNVWGIIWPAQKKIIAWTEANAKDGAAMPAEAKALARSAFLASRANTWMSLPMLWLMGAAQHYVMFG